MIINNIYKYIVFTIVMELLYIILAVIVVSLVSLVGIFFVYKKTVSNGLLLFLLSLSVGTLFGGAFLHLLPEAVEHDGFGLTMSLSILSGILIFFIIEKFVHAHHKDGEHNHSYGDKKEEKCEHHSHKPHHHAYHLGIMNLIGDGIHNFIDGLIIAGSFLVSIPLGISTTIAVLLHEVPQEIADFGVLVYSGMSKKKALFYNFLSATLAIIGGIMGYLLTNASEIFLELIIPFAAGGFIYIAASNLIPELHRKCELKDSFLHTFAIILGIAIMYGLLFLEVAH